MFNFYESLLWIILAIVLFIIAYKNKKYQRISIIAGILFLTFGISDLVEINFQILPLWLWLWKIINTISLITVFGWYIKTK